MNTIQKLLSESTQSSASVEGRPTLVNLTRAVNDLIYEDLVAKQRTDKPQAALYGLRYKNPNDVMTFTTPATYAGKYGSRASINAITETMQLVKGAPYKDASDVVYVCLEAVDMNSAEGTTLAQKINILIMRSKLRIASEVAPVNYSSTQEIQDASFRLDLWKVDTGTRKFRTGVTHELIQDINANGLNGRNIVEDMLATTISEEINKDIMQTLQTVSIRHRTPATPEGIADLTNIQDDPQAGRFIYRLIQTMSARILSDTSFSATYVLASAAVVGYLFSSGWMRKDPSKPLAAGVLNSGLHVYEDSVTLYDYFLVGTKHKADDIDDKVGSLYYVPFQDVDDAGAFLFNVDPHALQPQIMCKARYALSVNPYTVKANQAAKEVIVGDDWSNLADRSKYSRFIGVVLPDTSSIAP